MRKGRFALALLLAFMFTIPLCPALGETPETAEESRLVITLTGRIGLGDTTRWNTQPRSLTVVQADKADDWLLGDFKELFTADDLTLGCLHMPFVNGEIRKPSDASLFNAPEEAVRFLTAAGVDAVCLADESVGDYSTAGYANTQRVLDEAGILHFGTMETRAGDTFDELLIWLVKDTRIGVVGYDNPTERDVPAILERVNLLREHGCGIVIVSVEWAKPDANSPTSVSFNLAQQLVDGGADVIWGHGSDALHPIYFYKGKPVIMSLGALCDGYSGAVDTFGAVLHLEYDLTGETPELRVMRTTALKTGKRGEYNPFVLQIEKNRKVGFSKLIPQKSRGDMTAIPKDFADTGILWIEPDGSIRAK